MKPNRKMQSKPVPAEVISLEAYRRARGMPAPAKPDQDGVIAAYCRWLAVAGALWTFWW